MSVQLTEQTHRILSAVGDAEAPPVIEALAEQLALDQAPVSAEIVTATERGWVTVDISERIEVLLDGGDPAELPPLPERLALAHLQEAGGAVPMKDLAGWAKGAGAPMSDVIKWGVKRGWLAKDKGQLTMTDAGRAALDGEAADEQVLGPLAAQGRLFLDALDGVDGEAAAELLKNRTLDGHKIKLKDRKERRVSLTADGRALLAAKDLKVVREQTQLSAEDLASGAWKDIALRPYDVTLPAEVRRPHKSHPLMRILQETRRAFLRMGFSEIVSPHVESAFWDFDALFQPQDHPARDMQDTFYLSSPEHAKLPKKALIEAVRATHEDGGKTGSAGWGYAWDAGEAKRTVLRTHTTASTIRALADDPNPPRKVFCVGRVFRNETISYKHLPEFTQVDGIIIDEHASFRYLLGTLTEFYRQMGFEKVKFKPAFFPYTEPSAEVFVWFEPKRTWIELGGSGVFRPEVTQPLGCSVPVLAWGLGLERLAMLRYDLTDIRQLYWSDLDWLREVRLCQ